MTSNNIYLYTTYYNEQNKLRNAELLESIKRNALNPEIKSVTVFNEGDALNALNTSKIIDVRIDKRPTYMDFINYINTKSTPEDIHIIANTDIFFDKHIGVLKQVLDPSTCFALSRWDTTESKRPLLYNHNDSQDAWIFKGRIKEALRADFPLGVPRCDNKFMYEIENAGYVVLNPSFSIKSYHLHEGQRAIVYSENDNKYNLQRPFRYQYPHNLFGLWKTLLFNVSHSHQLGNYCYDLKKANGWLLIRLYRKAYESITGKQFPLIGYQPNPTEAKVSK